MTYIDYIDDLNYFEFKLLLLKGALYSGKEQKFIKNKSVMFDYLVRFI